MMTVVSLPCWMLLSFVEWSLPLPFVYHVIWVWHVVNEPWVWMLLLLFPKTFPVQNFHIIWFVLLLVNVVWWCCLTAIWFAMLVVGWLEFQLMMMLVNQMLKTMLLIPCCCLFVWSNDVDVHDAQLHKPLRNPAAVKPQLSSNFFLVVGLLVHESCSCDLSMLCCYCWTMLLFV